MQCYTGVTFSGIISVNLGDPAGLVGSAFLLGVFAWGVFAWAFLRIDRGIAWVFLRISADFLLTEPTGRGDHEGYFFLN